METIKHPAMRVAVFIDCDTVGPCPTLREVSLRRVDVYAVAAHGSPHQRAASVVCPSSTRSAALDQIVLMIGIFVGARSPWARCWCCGLVRAPAPHVILVTRDHERGSSLKSLFLYDQSTRSRGVTYTHATSEAEAILCLRDAALRRGWLASVCCAGMATASCLGSAVAFAASFVASNAAKRVRTRRGGRSPTPPDDGGGGAPDHDAASPLIKV